MNAVASDLTLDPLEAGLRRHFSLDGFRPGQREVVESVLAGRNTVVVMPTGAGKSLCFQLPAMLLDGVTIVVSPLIALMQDQVESLLERGIAATFINSTLTDGERADRQRRLREREYKLVYVAPERFRSEAFVSALIDAGVSLFAIDEAHCISQWGHDFRPEYAQLGQVRKRLRPPRTVALTATATPEVREDITRVLLLKEPHVYVAGFDRPNLFLEVQAVSGEEEKRQGCAALAEEGSGIIYCSTRKQAENIHQSLVDEGLDDVVLYHAGLNDDARKRAQDQFMLEPNAVAVATNAFGMGIDKAGIRFVAHASIPRAVEAYYQEIGRAGRDGRPAHAVLFFNHADVYTQERLIQSSHPADAMFRDVWEALRDEETFDRGVQMLATQVGASEFEISAVLKLLERAGAIHRGNRGQGRYGFTLVPGATPPRTADAKATLEAVKAVLGDSLRGSTDLELLARRSGLAEDRIRTALNALEKAGVMQVQRPFSGKSISVLRHDGWDQLGVNLLRLRAEERNQLLLLKRMTDFAYVKRCRRAFIMRYFGETASFGASCGSCDVCVGAKLVKRTRTRSRSSAAGAKLVAPARAAPEQFSALAVDSLKRFRRELAADLSVPPFIIFNDATLYALAAALPSTQEEFMRVKGTGPSRWERFGPKILEICVMARAAGDAPSAVIQPARSRRSLH